MSPQVSPVPFFSPGKLSGDGDHRRSCLRLKRQEQRIAALEPFLGFHSSFLLRRNSLLAGSQHECNDGVDVDNTCWHFKASACSAAVPPLRAVQSSYKGRFAVRPDPTLVDDGRFQVVCAFCRLGLYNVSVGAYEISLVRGGIFYVHLSSDAICTGEHGKECWRTA